jgi:hypothetical protein
VVLDGGVDVGLLPVAMAAGVLRARVTEDGGEVVEELLHVGVVLLVPLTGMKRLCTGGSTGGRAAAEEGARRRCGPAVLVEEMEIDLLCELLWVVAMLLMHWIRV